MTCETFPFQYAFLYLIEAVNFSLMQKILILLFTYAGIHTPVIKIQVSNIGKRWHSG